MATPALLPNVNPSVNNPIVTELMNLSPAAKAALGMAGHTMPPEATAAPDVVPTGARGPGLLPSRNPSTDAAPAPLTLHMPQNVPKLMAPDAPHVAAPVGTFEGDENKRLALQNSPPGVGQIQQKIEDSTFGQNHPTAGKLLGGVAQVAGKVGDYLLSNALPGPAAQIPGTTAHRNLLLDKATTAENADLGTAKAEEGIQDTKSQEEERRKQGDFYEGRPGIEQGKIDEKQKELRGHLEAAAGKNGEKVTWDDEGNPTFTDDPESQAYRDRVSISALHDANADRATILADIAHNKFVPGTPEYADAQRRLLQADHKIALASGNLGMRRKEFGLKAGDQTLHPGQMVDETGAPVGTAFQGNVKPTVTSQQAGERAQVMQEVQSRIQKALADPEIQAYMGPVAGRAAEAAGDAGILPQKVSQFRNDLISYGAFQAGLHPVRGIGALQYFDKVMGGLHQTPEELQGKLNSNEGTAESVEHVGAKPVGHVPAAGAPKPVAPTGGPKPGDVVDGYKFKGGDASKQANWEQVKK